MHELVQTVLVWDGFHIPKSKIIYISICKHQTTWFTRLREKDKHYWAWNWHVCILKTQEFDDVKARLICDHLNSWRSLFKKSVWIHLNTSYLDSPSILTNSCRCVLHLFLLTRLDKIRRFIAIVWNGESSDEFSYFESSRWMKLWYWFDLINGETSKR